MRIGRRNLAQRDFRMLWDQGTIVGQSDAELLRLFVKGPAEVSDPAFRAILARHGPMVLGACRRLLADEHDVEDAFQATFLVLVRRADSLRVTDTLGPWLHEVARRVTLEARAIALRRRARENQSTDLAAFTAHGSGVNLDDTRLVIDEEVCKLTPNMRAAVVLCDLEGMTIEGAAHQLGWPSGTVRSRLARGRERLRSRLARRGLDPASEALVGVPPTVVEALAVSTSRIAILSLTGIKTAGVVPASVLILTQGVLPMLFWNRAKTAVGTILAFIAIGAGIASAMLAEEPVRGTPAPQPKRDRTKPPAKYQVTGVIRVEGTREPVPGAKLRIFDDRTEPKLVTTTSNPDGRYQLNLAPGEWQAVSVAPPAGYWVEDVLSAVNGSFVLSSEAPVYQRDFVVRRGTIWTFQATGNNGSSDREHIRLGATNNLEPEFTIEPAEKNPLSPALYPSESEENGQIRLTLPSEGKRLKLMVALSPSDDSDLAMSRPVAGLLEWTTNFQPASLERIEKTGRGYHLVDRAGRTADLQCGEELELTESNGKLGIALKLKKPAPPRSGSLIGLVVDREGRPVEGVKITLLHHVESPRAKGRDGLHAIGIGLTRLTHAGSEEEVSTAGDGRFLIPRIRFTGRDGEAPKLSVSAKKQGYASATSPPFVFHPGVKGEPHVLSEPVRLEPSVSVGGTVVDPSGKAVVGARVWGWQGPQSPTWESTRTDHAGRFLLNGLTKGTVTLKCDYGELQATNTITLDGKVEDVRLQLRLVTTPTVSPR